MFHFQPVLVNRCKTLVNGLAFDRENDYSLNVPQCKWQWNGDCALFADDLRYLSEGQFKAGIDQAKASFVEVKHGTGVAFHFAVSWRIDSRSDRYRSAPIDCPAQIHRIAPHIHQGATCQTRLQTNIVWSRTNVEGKRGMYQLHRPNVSCHYLL